MHCSIIIDFETLDTSPSAIVTEIGAIAIHRGTGSITNQLDLRPCILSQLADGRTFTAETIHWHRKKGTLSTSLWTATESPASCTARLMAFIQEAQPFRIWAWGKDFERPLFENLCKQYQVAIPDYQFRKFTCARDIWQHAFGLEARPPERTHHALQDCHDELRDLREALLALDLIDRL